MRIEQVPVGEVKRGRIDLHPLLAQHRVDEFRDRRNDTRAKTVALFAAKIPMWGGHVKADEVRARAAIEFPVHESPVALGGGAQLRGHGTRGIGIAKKLAEEQRTRNDGATGSFAGDPTASKALIGRGRAPKRLGEGDPTGPMWRAYPVVEHEGLAPDGSALWSRRHHEHDYRTSAPGAPPWRNDALPDSFPNDVNARFEPVWSQSDDVRARIEGMVESLVAIRRDIHRHPELGFEEFRTQSLVEDWLHRHGYAPHRSAETGVYADLNPGHPGPTIALRADLDGLPMDESTPLTHRSVHPGRAHKCGHDGHTAVLLGTAALLATYRDVLPGNVRFLFQPAEEGVRGGGARRMVAEGLLDGVAEVYGLHNWPDFPQGQIRVRSGPTMAQTLSMHITVTGQGGHGSQPQVCRDPIVAASHLVCALQTVVARGLGYEGGAVLSICAFQAGSTTNVIPARAELAGTIRAFDPCVTERVLERTHEIARGIAQTFGVRVEVTFEGDGYPVLVNDSRCAEAVERVAGAVVGRTNVSGTGLPLAAGEDFAYMTQAIAGAYFFVGAGAPEGSTPGCHHADFDFNDGIIPTAMRMFAGLVEDRLSRLSSGA